MRSVGRVRMRDERAGGHHGFGLRGVSPCSVELARALGCIADGRAGLEATCTINVLPITAYLLLVPHGLCSRSQSGWATVG